MSTWRRRALAWASIWRAAPALTALGLALVAGTAISTWAVMATGSSLVAAVTQGTSPWLPLGWTTLALLASATCSHAVDSLAEAHQSAVTCALQRQVVAAVLAPHGVAHLEDGGSRARAESALEGVRGDLALLTVPAAWSLLTIRAEGLAAVAAVGAWSWPAAGLLVLAQVAFGRTFTRYLSDLQADMFGGLDEHRNRQLYLRDLALTPGTAKELRVFAMTGWATDRFREAAAQVARRSQELSRRGARTALLGGLMRTLITGAVLLWLGHDAWDGRLGVPTLLLALQGVVGMQAWGPLGDTSVQAVRLQSAAEAVHRLRAELGGPTPVTAGPQPAPEPGRAVASPHPAGPVAIDVDDVTFTYPTRTTPVFTGLTLHVPPGQSVALVGVNGVGKSTLVSLLCGLHVPDRGTVRVAGRDPAEDDAARRRVAAIFQDFSRYPLSLADNVSTDPALTDDQRARALHDAAGDDVLARVGGWDTVLDPSYAGGTDLSGGQWQRVALARALAAVKAGAGALVLDEPTAALDVRAEAEIFDRFLEVTRSVTTLLVSHRLSSVRRAQRIVVIGPHGVVEDGSHEELLARDGEYAAMFRLQAARFAAAGKEQ